MNNETQVAVIAGVGPGLGASLCRTLAGAGYRVAGLARGTAYGEQLASEINNAGGRLLPLACDITDARALDESVTRIENELGPASVYVHHASQLVMNPFLEIAPEEFESLWRVTFLGAVLGAQRVLPTMVKQQRGALLFTGATAALRGGSKFAAFASAKFALRGLAQSLAREFGPQGIHVAHVVIDGIIWTERTRQFPGVTEDTCLQPDAIAQTYLQLIQQDPSAWTQELDLRPSVEKF